MSSLQYWKSTQSSEAKSEEKKGGMMYEFSRTVMTSLELTDNQGLLLKRLYFYIAMQIIKLIKELACK